MDITHQKAFHESLKPMSGYQPPRAPSSGDMDFVSKFKEQERLSSYLVDQINKLEEKCQDLSIKLQTQQLAFKEQRQKLESRMRTSREDNSLDELQSRIINIEEVTKREDRNRKEINEKVKRTEIQLKEIQNLAKQVTQNEDLHKFREIIHENIVESQKNTQKNKEKSQVLFTEVVRLGQQLEANQQLIKSMNSNFESKIQMYDQKLREKEIEIEQQRNLVQNNFNSEFIGKIEERMNLQEQTLNNISNALKKENTHVEKLQNVATRLQDDMKIALTQLQQEFVGKLENR